VIICEVGLNHCGDVEYATQYLDEIIKCNSDAILFHMREKSFYEDEVNNMNILPDLFYIDSVSKAHFNNIKFGITISDVDKIQFCEKICVDFYKILSQDIHNFVLIKQLLLTKKPLFISTGLSDISEINTLVNFIKDAEERVTLIHTQLRSDLKFVNLKAIPMLYEKFHLKVAFGNHSENPNVLILSLAYEPSDIFFYVKGSKVKKHQDEINAVNLNQLYTLISELKKLPLSIGHPIKLKLQINDS